MARIIKNALVFIFFFTVFSLTAQSYRETRIYVPPIDGIGMIDDMAYFYKQITKEITDQHRTLGRSRRTSDFVVTGRLSPIEEAGEPLAASAVNHEYVLFVELFNNRTREAVGTQYITYLYPDITTDEALSVIIYNFLSGVPDLIEEYSQQDAWRNKWFYLNASFLWTPRVYSADFQSVHIASVGVEAMLDIHVLSFMAVKIGAELVQDWVVFRTASGEAYTDMIIDFPLALAFVLRPGNSYLLKPYIGANYNMSLMGVTRPYYLSWMAGFQMGIKAGAGILTLDPRFSMDLGESHVLTKQEEPYWRYTIHLGFGYKLGFINR
jgi:hypothetical protein